jgi:hypothetical protein
VHLVPLGPKKQRHPNGAQRELRKGTGILKVAKALGLGTGTVHRIKREMTAN